MNLDAPDKIKTITELAVKIKKVCDLYWDGELKENDAKAYINFWAKNEGLKMFKGSELNPTLKKNIGKKRAKLLNQWIDKK